MYAGPAGYLVGAMHKQVQPDIQLYQYISVLPMCMGIQFGGIGLDKIHIGPDIYAAAWFVKMLVWPEF